MVILPVVPMRPSSRTHIPRPRRLDVPLLLPVSIYVLLARFCRARKHFVIVQLSGAVLGAERLRWIDIRAAQLFFVVNLLISILGIDSSVIVLQVVGRHLFYWRRRADHADALVWFLVVDGGIYVLGRQALA